MTIAKSPLAHTPCRDSSQPSAGSRSPCHLYWHDWPHAPLLFQRRRTTRRVLHAVVENYWKALYGHANAGSGRETGIEKVHSLTRLQYAESQADLYYSGIRTSRARFLPLAYLFLWRFFIVPVISISVVYGLRSRWPHYIKSDPVIDFVLAISHVGPPAITLAAMADMSGLDQEEQGVIATVLLASYVVTPLISLSVSGIMTIVVSLCERTVRSTEDETVLMRYLAG